MNLENNKKVIAELEVRIRIKVYRLEFTSKMRWVWVAGLILLKMIYQYFSVR